MASGVTRPDDLVLIAHISGAYGVQGWVKIKPYSSHADALLHARTWWLDKPEWHDVAVLDAKYHSGEVVARLMGVTERNAAETLKGAALWVSRRHFPVLAEDEYYWVDLLGLDVENLLGEHLGQVAGMMDSGAHPILRVERQAASELLIPFVEQFVKSVDQSAKKIRVDWGWDD